MMRYSRHILRIVRTALLVTLAAALLAGCGGGGGKPSGAGGGAGGTTARARAVVTIVWPKRGRYIPTDANYVRLTVGYAGQVPSSVSAPTIPPQARPTSDPPVTQITIDNLYPTTMVFTAEAYLGDSSGNPVHGPNTDMASAANVQVDLTNKGGQTYTVPDIVMDSTMDHMNVLSNGVAFAGSPAPQESTTTTNGSATLDLNYGASTNLFAQLKHGATVVLDTTNDASQTMTATVVNGDASFVTLTNPGNAAKPVTLKAVKAANTGTAPTTLTLEIAFADPQLPAAQQIKPFDVTVNIAPVTVDVLDGATVVTGNTIPVEFGATKQLASRINGTGVGTVTWTMPTAHADGGVDPASGLVTAPTAPGDYTVTATYVPPAGQSDLVNPNSSASVTIHVPRAVHLSPAGPVNLDQGAVQAFASTTNLGDNSVNWAIQEGSPAGGTLSANTGTSTNYTAPNAQGTYHLVATSVADNTVTATVTINVPAIQITFAPTSVTTTVNQTVAGITATVTGAVNKNVTWTIQEGSPAGGTLSNAGPTTVDYMAPAAAGTYHIVATSAQDNTTAATLTVTVNP